MTTPPGTGKRVVAFAYSGFGHAGLSALLRSGANVVLVLSHADKPGENVWWPSTPDLARHHGIPVLLDADLRDPAVVERIAALQPDFLFSFYFRSMIPGRILKLAKHGGYNLHGSLLPRYRGRAPLNWQLVHGETRTGLTLHRMVLSADAGDIVAQTATEVGPDEDAFTLVNRLLAMAPAFLDTAFSSLFSGTAIHRPQDHALANVFSGRTPADGRIDWTWPARRIHNLVRAVSHPFPGASCTCAGHPLLIWRTRMVSDHGHHGEPGTMRADGWIACGDGGLEIIDYTAPDDLTLKPGLRLA
jgi:UDP-4-amino-4-deoxy-L-arabinose formyltransferase/UDP-glucuronic acid dehydrogenase (UDP-4-keto-hexauronic acid decarboxylating)